jgi:tRNA1Val (adenine37-N6)-methyltransferase
MSVFKFKEFNVIQSDSAMKVGTDAMVLGALIDCSGATKGLDIGAGTGVLSLMVAQKNADITIDAVELDAVSAGECTTNFQNSKWSNRLNAVCADFLDIQSTNKFDLIFSNPPYYQSRFENNDERKAKARHESSLPMEQMVERVKGLLSETGSFWIIVPSELMDAWNSVCTSHGMHNTSCVLIQGKEEGPISRVVLKYEMSAGKLSESNLCIRKKGGTYTEAYKQLTLHFHYNDLT